MRSTTKLLTWAFWVGWLVSVQCRAADGMAAPSQQEQHAAEQAITEAALRGHIRFLADDLLEGRGPGTKGDLLAQRYIAAQFESLGMKPAAPRGGFFQPVPLVGVTTDVPETIALHRDAEKKLTLRRHDDYVFVSGKPDESVGFENAELVFVGYGIVAPEFQWDDYKGTDLRGKILVVMNNDPADDPNLFAGKRRLYYGRWDYKYEMAARQGAAGAIIIHTTASAGYPFQVVQTSWAGEEFELRDTSGPRLEMRGWFTEEAARQVAKLSGHDLDALRATAEHRDFRPVPLGTRLSLSMKCQVREQQTTNVFGILPGTDPELSSQHVVFMAHHDHLGIGAPDLTGDRIFNGAVDNASGVGALLAIARACALLPRPPRSMLFAAVGAEEQGLLGSKYMAEHPPVPAGTMAVVLNMDGVNILGPTRDVQLIGSGKSSMDAVVQDIAAWQNRAVTPDQFPDRGYYYRSDQFSLAKVGVPGVYFHSGTSVIGKPEGWGRKKLEEWTETNYHQPSDEYRDDWDLGGAVADVRLMFYAGMVVARQPELPSWVPGDEFEAARKKAIAEAGRQP